MKPKDKLKTRPLTIHFTAQERAFLDAKKRETGNSLTDVIRNELGLTKLAAAWHAMKAMKKSAKNKPLTNAYSAQ